MNGSLTPASLGFTSNAPIDVDLTGFRAWTPPASDVARIIDGEIATIGLLTAMTGKTASMWMPQDVAETLVQRHTSGGSIRLARIDPLDPEMATLSTADGSRRIHTRIAELPEHVIDAPE